ncbi:YncE family protein [Ideonella sp. A 288]|uniref:YncE family protein n=1 Tax=Ideonella sp. A 288 TaxID=1962181 RepID=UPI001F2C4975|nr:cytochrome D1 domain-containing protein [Ideonella sp. A 288]
MKFSSRMALAVLALSAIATHGTAAVAADAPSATAAVPAAAVPAAQAASGAFTERLVQKGVSIEYSLTPSGTPRTLTEGDFAEVRFRITDEATGQPVRTSTPGAWMDMAQIIQGRGAEQKSCKDKVSLYLKGVVGIRPMLDLNSYFVVLMNNDSTLSVVDPVVSMAGATSSFASVMLKSPGADWAPSDRERRLYVSMPRANQVAVIDTDGFKLIDSIDAGQTPVRVVQQPDGRFLWVGNNAKEEAASGVTIIDVQTLKPVGFVATGAGHHEIAFSADSRLAFVSNRNAGTLAVVDVATRKVVKTLSTGTQPISVGYSPLSRSVYVADGKDGSVAVIDTDKLEVGKRIALKAGLGPLRVSPDGRFALLLNPREDLVHVIDLATNEAVQNIEVSGQPFQLMFTKTFAYVRSIHSERVRMINLASLGKGMQPVVQSFAAGGTAPGQGAGTAIADTVATAAGEGTVFVVNPSDGSTYFYMEGMNAPSSNYKVQGSSPRAVTVVDRSLKEVEPGVFEGRVRIPVPGTYDVAFMMQSPQVLHCFSATAAENPALAKARAPLRMEFETTQRQFKVGETAAIRFKMIDGPTNAPKLGMDRLRVMYFQAPGRHRTEVSVKEIGEGVYEASVPLVDAGAWYVYVGMTTEQSATTNYGELPFYSLQAMKATDAKSALSTR